MYEAFCTDVGGTFTDCLVMDESGLLQKFKAPTTPRDPSIGFMDAMKKAARHYQLDVKDFFGQIEVLIHGTSLATNILLTSRGARAGMITTKGFRDTIEIRRGIKPIDVSLYNLFIPPNDPLIPRWRRIGVEVPACAGIDGRAAPQRATDTTFAAIRRHPCRPRMVTTAYAWFCSRPDSVAVLGVTE